MATVPSRFAPWRPPGGLHPPTPRTPLLTRRPLPPARSPPRPPALLRASSIPGKDDGRCDPSGGRARGTVGMPAPSSSWSVSIRWREGKGRPGRPVQGGPAKDWRSPDPWMTWMTRPSRRCWSAHGPPRRSTSVSEGHGARVKWTRSRDPVRSHVIPSRCLKVVCAVRMRWHVPCDLGRQTRSTIDPGRRAIHVFTSGSDRTGGERQKGHDSHDQGKEGGRRAASARGSRHHHPGLDAGARGRSTRSQGACLRLRREGTVASDPSLRKVADGGLN